MTSQSSGALKLAGYVRLADQGFALPAYGAGFRANAWYIAVPTVDGDHAATIDRFELLEGEQVTSLPEAAISVSEGMPWQDVFLWNDHVFCGAPDQIFAALTRHSLEIRRFAPLSYLDLALAAGVSDAVELSLEVQAFLAHRLSTSQAASAFRNLVLRPGVLIALRRRLHSKDRAAEGLQRLTDVTLTELDENVFEATLPKEVAEILGRQATAELDLTIRTFGETLGVALQTVYLDFPANLTTKESASARDRGESSAAATGDEDTNEKRRPTILVIASDKRASQIASYLLASRASDTDQKNTGRLPAFVIEGVDGASASALLQYDLVIGLVSNELLRDSSAVEGVVAKADLNAGAPFLIAPVPPADGPTHLFAPHSEAGASAALLSRCDAIIDTTYARSPFWKGNSRRSIDRRMGDIIRSISLAFADHRMREKLEEPPGDSPRILSTFPREKVDSSFIPRSELNMPSPGDLVTRVETSLPDLVDGNVRRGTVEMRPLRQDFQRFATAVVSLSTGQELVVRDDTTLPETVRETLENSWQVALGSFSADASDLVIVTGEVPDLRTLRAGRAEGASVVRYTDHKGLRALRDAREGERLLPSHIKLPPLDRYARNRGFATRGVDARDVVRLPEEGWLSLLKEAGKRSPLIGQSRSYRAALTGGHDARAVALPALAILDADAAGDVLARYIIELVPRFQIDYGGAVARKRVSDLAAAWSRPAGHARRWIIEDGLVPVEIAVLSPEEVPAQRLFLIDGDEAVPALLLSRLFSVWARALLPSSTSWSSRFQVGQTFDAFPLTLSFTVTPANGGSPPQLRFSDQSESAAALTKLVGPDAAALLFEAREAGRDERRLRAAPLMREVDAILLADIGLGREADDLDILERLIDRNRSQQ